MTIMMIESLKMLPTEVIIDNPNELTRGDIVRVESSPNSQKHFYDPMYSFYFPNRTGKVISGGINRSWDDIIVKDLETGERFDLKNRIGTSGYQVIYKLKK